MCVLIFSTTFERNISHSKNNSARYCHKQTFDFVQTTRYSCQLSVQLSYSRQFFEKCSNIKFHEVRPVEDELFMRTDGRTTDMNKVIGVFRKFANSPKNMNMRCQRYDTQILTVNTPKKLGVAEPKITFPNKQKYTLFFFSKFQ